VYPWKEFLQIHPVKMVQSYARAFGRRPRRVTTEWRTFENGRQDPITELLAKKIIEAALAGERDPDRLCEAALRDLGNCTGS
jgi:hypothetical protein